jgi:serpin B
MRVSSVVSTFTDSEVTALELPYQGGAFAMDILLPTRPSGLAALEQGLDAERLGRLLAAMEPSRSPVLLHLPRFKLAGDSRDFTADLAQQGMPSVFDAKSADLSGVAGAPGDIVVSAVVHRAFVEVNEEGSEAAAATGVVVGEGSSRPAPRELIRVDHPFVFAIRDTQSGALLFLGHVVDPR